MLLLDYTKEDYGGRKKDGEENKNGVAAAKWSIFADENTSLLPKTKKPCALLPAPSLYLAPKATPYLMPYLGFLLLGRSIINKSSVGRNGLVLLMYPVL